MKISIKNIDRVIKEMYSVPKDGKAKTPCSKCVGITVGCMAKSKRNPDKECGAFYNKSMPIKIEMR